MNIIQSIQNRIYEIRGERVILDRDLADLYEVEVKVLNQAVKRNIKRFPKDFMFQLTKEEFEQLRFQIETSKTDISSRSQIVTLKTGRGSNIKYLPYNFRTRCSHAEWHSPFRKSNCHEHCHHESICGDQKNFDSGKSLENSAKSHQRKTGRA